MNLSHVHTCLGLVNVDFNQSISQSINQSINYLYVMPKDFFNQSYQDFHFHFICLHPTPLDSELILGVTHGQCLMLASPTHFSVLY